MKIAIFSDIHGNYQALDSILNHIKKGNYDETIFLGDAIALGPDSMLCLKRLYSEDIIYILGNHELYSSRGTQIDNDMEDYKIEHHNWVESTLKDIKVIDNNNLKYEFELYGKKYKFQHFFLRDNMYPFEHLGIYDSTEFNNILEKENADYIFYGHDHKGRYIKYKNKEFYGIGSSGCILTSKTYYYEINITENETSVKKVKVNYNRKKFINRIRSINYKDKKRISNIFFGIK